MFELVARLTNCWYIEGTAPDGSAIRGRRVVARRGGQHGKLRPALAELAARQQADGDLADWTWQIESDDPDAYDPHGRLIVGRDDWPDEKDVSE